VVVDFLTVLAVAVQVLLAHLAVVELQSDKQLVLVVTD